MYQNGSVYSPDRETNEGETWTQAPLLQTRAAPKQNRRRSMQTKIKTLDDFSVRTPAISPCPSPVPSTSRSSTPEKPKMVIGSLVAQRFARLTKKLDNEEEQDKVAAQERESKRYMKRGGRGNVMSMAPGELAKVSHVEVSVS